MAQIPEYINVVVRDNTRNRIFLKSKIMRGGEFHLALGPDQTNHPYLIAYLKDNLGYKVDIEIKILRGSTLKFNLGHNTEQSFKIKLPKNCPVDQKKFIIRGGHLLPAMGKDLEEW